MFWRSEDKNDALEEKLRNVNIGGGSVQERIQQLQEENASLKSALVQKSAEWVLGSVSKML